MENFNITMNRIILFEDEYFAIVVKYIGEDSQCFFKSIWQNKKYAEAVNRLDKSVSGLVVIAFLKNIHFKLNALFMEHKVKKEYWAICTKKENIELNKMQIAEDNISFNTKIQKGFIAKNTVGAKKSVLYWELCGIGENYNFLRIFPITGRTHQIRIQLANIGMPIKGDVKYGFSRTEKLGGIRLHAYALKFQHPITGENIEYSAFPQYSDALWDACKKACLKSKNNLLDIADDFPKSYGNAD